jgi:hypothetical protein
MLKEVMHEVAHPLCLLFNKSLQERKFPKDWKLAHVIPISKSGDKSLVSNYRPIALLCTVSKIFEKVVYKNSKKHSTSWLITPLFINSSQDLYLVTPRHTN